MLSFQHIINSKLLLKYFTLYFMILSLEIQCVFYAYCACMLRHSVTSDSATPWTVARQASLSVGFSQQEYWNGVPFPPPGYLPDAGIKPPSCVGWGFFTTSATWGALCEQFSSVQSLSRVRLSVTPWTAARQASLSIANSRSSVRLMSIESAMPSNHLILCCPLFLLPSIFPSIRVFSNESTLHVRWPEYWSFSFNISPSNEYSGLISFRMDWLDLLAFQGTLKSFLQHHSSKASILWRSAFFNSQLSHPYMTSGKTIALTSQTFGGKVMSLLFSMLSRLVITFLPRGKRLNFTAAVTICSDFGPTQNKVSHCFPIYLP